MRDVDHDGCYQAAVQKRRDAIQMKNTTFGVLMFLFAMTTLSLPASQVGIEYAPAKTLNSRIYGMVEQWNYKDILAEEKGPLYGLGVGIQNELIPLFWLELRGELFTGKMDQKTYYGYDNGHGHIYRSSDTINIPTTYNGYKLEATLVLKLPVTENICVDVYGGVGRRSWTRFMKIDQLSSGDIEEDWVMDYAILGVGGNIAIDRDSWLWCRAEARVPFNNELETKYQYESYYFRNSKIEQENKLSVYAEAGVTARRLSASVFIETLEFEIKDSPQEAKATMVGGKLGIAL